MNCLLDENLDYDCDHCPNRILCGFISTIKYYWEPIRHFINITFHKDRRDGKKILLNALTELNLKLKNDPDRIMQNKQLKTIMHIKSEESNKAL